VNPIAALQTEYSLWSRDPEGELLDTVRELGIGFVAYSPLGRGLLTGAIKSTGDFTDGDYRARHPRFVDENFERNMKVVALLESMAAAKNITAAQLALAWLLHRGDDVVPIPGTKHRGLLEQNCAAVDVDLTADDVARIAAVAKPGAFAGERYADMSSVNA